MGFASNMNRSYHFPCFAMAYGVVVDVHDLELCAFVNDDEDVAPNRIRDDHDHIDNVIMLMITKITATRGSDLGHHDDHS